MGKSYPSAKKQSVNSATPADRASQAMKIYLYLYIYIYIYIYWQHFFVNTIFIEHNRHFLSTYFLLDPFVLPYCSYRIRQELIHVLSIVVCIPSTFCPTLGHHQWGDLLQK